MCHLSCCTCISGMVANILAFAVLSQPTNCVMFHLLRSLALADFFFLVGTFMTQILINLYPVLGIMEKMYTYSGYLIKYITPLVLMFQTTSIWLTVIISIERYLAVCQPLVAHRYGKPFRMSKKNKNIWKMYINKICIAFLYSLA